MSIRHDIQLTAQPFETVFSKYGLRAVKSSSLSRVFELGKYGFFILSANRPEYESGDIVKYRRARQAGMTADVYEDQFSRYKELQQDLIDRGVGYTTLIGKYHDDDNQAAFHEELSVFVPFRNRKQAVFANDPFEFYEYALGLAKKFDQTSLVFGSPPEKDQEVRVWLLFTGLRDEPAETKYDIGSFHSTDVQDNYLSILTRANHSQRGKPQGGQEGKAFKYATAALGIRWKDPEWGGQVVVAQREILFLLDNMDNITD